MPGYLTSDFYLYDPSDQTKQLKFDTSALGSATLQTLVVPWGTGASRTMAYANDDSHPGGHAGVSEYAGV
jgi:hypothetical protein